MSVFSLVGNILCICHPQCVHWDCYTNKLCTIWLASVYTYADNIIIVSPYYQRNFVINLFALYYSLYKMHLIYKTVTLYIPIKVSGGGCSGRGCLGFPLPQNSQRLILNISYYDSSNNTISYIYTVFLNTEFYCCMGYCFFLWCGYKNVPITTKNDALITTQDLSLSITHSKFPGRTLSYQSSGSQKSQNQPQRT